MITILRGSRLDIRHHPAIVDAARFDTVVRLDADPAFLAPWAGARSLLAQLRSHTGDDAVERAIAPHRALLSLVLRRLSDQLSPTERELRDSRSALYAFRNGFFRMPDMDVSGRPLIEAWTGLFSALIADRDVLVVIPDVSCFDADSLALVRPLRRALLPGSRLRFVIGHDPDVRPTQWLDRCSQLMRERELALLESFSNTTVEQVLESGADLGTAMQTGREPDVVDPLDDQLEREAWDVLTRSSDALDAEQRELAVRGVRGAFEAFGFAAALRLALAVLARCPDLPERPEVHAIAAMAAHRLPQLSRSGDEGSALAERHYQLALAGEETPARRIHLLYRLSFWPGAGRATSRPRSSWRIARSASARP